MNAVVNKGFLYFYFMETTFIKTEAEYEHSLARVDIEFDKNLQPDSLEGKNLLNVIELIKDYEDIHYPIPTP